MKKFGKLLGNPSRTIIILATITGLLLASCPNENNRLDLRGTVTITGNAQVGETLTADTSGLNGSGTIFYDWPAQSHYIHNSDTYVVTEDDVGSTITVTVQREGMWGWVTSAPTAIVLAIGEPTRGLDFTLINSGTTYSVAKGTATVSAVTIPAIHEGLPVTEIADSGFTSYPNLKSIIIPDGVMRIGDYAFFYCGSLTSITIPAAVTRVGNSAFSNCDSLTTIYYGGTNSSAWAAIVKNSGNAPLADATIYYYARTDPGTTNTHWHFVDGVPELWDAGLSFTLINNDTAYSVSQGDATAATIIIPAVYEGLPVTEIAYNGFRDYTTNLTDITIPESVRNIGEYAFNGYSLTNITVNPNNPNYASQDGILYNKAKTAIVQVPRAISGNITLSNSVTSIGDYAFWDCRFTSITIPNSVMSIGQGAFDGCDGLMSITIPNSVTRIGEYAFVRCDNLTSITIPFVGNTLNGTENTHFGFIFGGYYYAVPESLRTITITGGNSIGEGAFSNCENLTSITLPNSVTSIGDYAFNGCGGLTDITIPASVTSIGDRAFSGCDGLTDITIPASVRSIGEYAFGCENLTSISVNANNPNYSSQDGILYNKTKTAIIHVPQSKSGSITIPSSVTSIGDAVFAGCNGLTSVTIPNSVMSIGDYAFNYCTGLTSIMIPNNVTSIGYGAFNGCSSLTMVFYGGANSSDWSAITIDNSSYGSYYSNTPLINATRYFYSETNPGTPNTHWHYVSGVPTVWN
jgi:hypothetical protein